MTENPIIKVGQIWAEIDPRHKDPRLVKVLKVCPKRGIEIRKVISCADHRFATHSRTTFAKPERFNGKRGGYTLIMEVQ